MAKESPESAAMRWRKLELVQAQYRDFGLFLDAAMDVLGFGTTDIQHDIGRFMVETGGDVAVEAQRSQAKSTVACCLAVWLLIMDPKHRVILTSGGEAKAKENSHLIVSLLTGMDELQCMLPDTQNGDRSSVEEFDIHYSLKGISASPSIRCYGITANSQGFRADTLIADDVETKRNSETQTQRDKLLDLTRDFPSICVGRPDDGVRPKTIWLGTPQSRDSIYNTLPGRGVTVRIWPGRYPTAEQLKNYEGMLAPLLLQRMQRNPGLMTGGGERGDQGQPVDPVIKNEAALRYIERNQGAPYFALQHMLSTALTDANRYPLKSEHLILASKPTVSRVPQHISRSVVPQTLVSYSVGSQVWKLQSPVNVSHDTTDTTMRIVAYVDPAAGGANGDETAYAIGVVSNATVWVLSIGGIRGGYDLAALEDLASRLALFRVTHVIVEKNLGYGAFREVFQPVMKRACEGWTPGFSDDLVTTMKERRICDILSPVIGRGSLVITQEALDQDQRDCERYGPEERAVRSVMFQITRMQPVKGAVKHDDRVDALAGLVGNFVQDLVALAAAEERKVTDREYREGIARALGHGPVVPQRTRRIGNIKLKDRRR